MQQEHSQDDLTAIAQSIREALEQHHNAKLEHLRLARSHCSSGLHTYMPTTSDKYKACIICHHVQYTPQPTKGKIQVEKETVEVTQQPLF